MNNLKKSESLDQLIELLDKNKNFAVLKFEKTTHQSFEGIRKNLKKVNSSLRVIKNSIFVKAVNKLSASQKVFANLSSKFFPMRENSALVILPTSDWNEGLSVIQNTSDKEKTLGFKFSLLDSVAYDETDTKKIAKLPGKNILAGKLISSMRNPIYKLLQSVKNPAQKLTYILNAKVGKH